MKPWTIHQDGHATLHIPTPFGDVKDVEVSACALDSIANRRTFNDAAVRMWSPEIGEASVGLVHGFLAQKWAAEYESEWRQHRRSGETLHRVALLLGMRPDDLLNGLRVALDEGALIRGMKHADKQPVDLLDWTHRFLRGLGFTERPEQWGIRTWWAQLRNPLPWMGGKEEIRLHERLPLEPM